MRIVFAGTPETAVPSLLAIAASDHDLVGVITRPDAPGRRGRTLHACAVAEAAVGLGVAVLKPDHPRDEQFQADLAALEPDCCAVVAYGAMLPTSALVIPPLGWINLHFSVLPAWRGAAPVQRAVWAGHEVTGATTFQIVKELDAGPIFGVMTETVRPDDTSESLLARLAQGGAGLLVATLDGLEAGELVARPQQLEGLSLAPKLTVEEARIDWSHPSVAIDRQVRACWPAPGAWTTWQGERFKVGPGTRLSGDTLVAGEIVVEKRAILVGTGVGSVVLGDVQAFGKKQMPAPDWARGEAAAAGGRFV